LQIVCCYYLPRRFTSFDLLIRAIRFFVGSSPEQDGQPGGAGGTETIRANVRIIAAANRDLG
jgi:hypothetical protein